MTRHHIRVPLMDRKEDRRPRGFVMRAQYTCEELVDEWCELSKEDRIERLSFIRECAEIAMEQLGGEVYWAPR